MGYRDIRAGRLNILPASIEDLEVLARMGLIEIDESGPKIVRDSQFVI